MSINDVNNQNTFDPSKRIRQSLGSEFVAEVEKDAIERLGLAANSGAVRSNTTTMYESNEYDGASAFKTMLDRREEKPMKNSEENTSKSQIDKLIAINCINQFNNMFDKSNRPKKSLNSILFDIGTESVIAATRAPMEAEFGACIRNNELDRAGVSAGALFIHDIARTYFQKEKFSLKEIITRSCNNNASCINAIACINAIVKGNKKERVKQMLLHATASIVVPAAGAFALGKMDKIKNSNNIFVKEATSFSSLSTIGKLALQGFNILSLKNRINKFNIMLLDEPDNTEKHMEELGKLVSKTNYAKTFDSSIGSYGFTTAVRFGMKAIDKIVTKTEFEIPENEPITLSKIAVLEEKPKMGVIIDKKQTKATVKPKNTVKKGK